MKSKRSKARQCKNLAKEHVENQDEPAALTGDSGHARWVQIAVVLFRVEINKSLRETEVYLNTMSPVLDELNLERSPDHTTICRWEQQYDVEELRDLLRLSAEQVGWTGVGAIDASGFQRNQTSYRYRNRANFSFHSMKTAILSTSQSISS